MDIFASIQPSAEQLGSLTGVSKPVAFWTDWLPLAEGQKDVHGVVLKVNESEFPYGLAFQLPGEEPELRLFNLAKEMSIKLGCRTLYTGCPLPEAKPHYCVVFDQGQAYLASDLGTVLMGDGDAPVTLIRRVPQWD